MGMFYKRRDYSTIVNGKNPIVAHEFLGDSVEGKDVVVIDDMISSGGSMLDVAKQIKERKAKREFICTTYGLFTEGLAKFDEYYEKGWIDRVITTNLNYRLPELLTKEYYIEANMSKYLASIIDIINHDVSVEKVRSNNEKIMELMEKVNKPKRELPFTGAPAFIIMYFIYIIFYVFQEMLPDFLFFHVMHDAKKETPGYSRCRFPAWKYVLPLFQLLT